MYRGEIHFMRLPDVGHFPAKHGTRCVWMEWVEDRFNGRKLQAPGYVDSVKSPTLPHKDHQCDVINFPQFAGPQWYYELPQGS
jgi:hypothetical protein